MDAELRGGRLSDHARSEEGVQGFDDVSPASLVTSQQRCQHLLHEAVGRGVLLEEIQEPELVWSRRTCDGNARLSRESTPEIVLILFDPKHPKFAMVMPELLNPGA